MATASVDEVVNQGLAHVFGDDHVAPIVVDSDDVVGPDEALVPVLGDESFGADVAGLVDAVNAFDNGDNSEAAVVSSDDSPVDEVEDRSGEATCVGADVVAE